MERTRWHEQYLYWHNRPLTTAAMLLVARLGKVVYFPGIGYAVNDPALAVQILSHPAFTSTGHGSMDELITDLVGPAALFNMDGAPHRALRSQVVEIFARRNIEARIGAEVRTMAAHLAADLTAGRRVDLVPVTRQIAGSATCGLLGIAVDPARRAADYAELTHLATQMTRFLGLDKLEPSAETLRQARVYYDQVLAFAAPSYAAAGGPAPTVIAQLKGAGLCFEDAAGLLAVLLLAGTETVLAALPRLVALLLDGGEFARLAADPALLPAAIAEGLRILCPSPAIPRAISADTELDGVRFKRGRRVIIILYNALKRPEYFPQPRRFDLTRTVDARFRHLCFGGGAHFCLGFALAHYEIGALLEALIGVPGGLRVVARRYPRDMSFPGYTSLVLERAA
jgi:cytochrome P450